LLEDVGHKYAGSTHKGPYPCVSILKKYIYLESK
jgi:hypothetical protein